MKARARPGEMGGRLSARLQGDVRIEPPWRFFSGVGREERSFAGELGDGLLGAGVVASSLPSAAAAMRAAMAPLLSDRGTPFDSPCRRTTASSAKSWSERRGRARWCRRYAAESPRSIGGLVAEWVESGACSACG